MNLKDFSAYSVSDSFYQFSQAIAEYSVKYSLSFKAVYEQLQTMSGKLSSDKKFAQAYD